MVNGRDYFMEEVLKDFAGRRIDPVSIDSEAPLFLMAPFTRTFRLTPKRERPWRIAEQLGVNIFHTSPTAIRMPRKMA